MFGLPFTFVDLFECLGTFAYAVSGLRLANGKRFDLFGSFVVGFATAVGGGTMRDVMLSQPPFWMVHVHYVIIVVFSFFLYAYFQKFINRIGRTLFLFDTIALALFTVAGFQKTIDAGYPYWVAIVMATFTGAAGGVMRDILINEEPLLFRKDIYALACIIGGVVYALFDYMGAPQFTSQVLCSVIVILIRILAVRYHWQLPSLSKENNE